MYEYPSEVNDVEIYTSSSPRSRELLADTMRSNHGDYEPLTTELEGLQGPPKGLQMAAAIKKGREMYEKGLYPNAIMWLSWAEALMPKEKPVSTIMDIIGCRIACFKQIGEYKKAILDCTKVIKNREEGFKDKNLAAYSTIDKPHSSIVVPG